MAQAICPPCPLTTWLLGDISSPSHTRGIASLCHPGLHLPATLWALAVSPGPHSAGPVLPGPFSSNTATSLKGRPHPQRQLQSTPCACRQRGAPAQHEHRGSRERPGGARHRPRSFLGVHCSPSGLDQEHTEEGRISRISGVLGHYTCGFQGGPHPPRPLAPLSAGQAQPSHCTTHSLCTDFVSSWKDLLSHHPACICVQSLQCVCNLTDRALQAPLSMGFLRQEF